MLLIPVVFAATVAGLLLASFHSISPPAAALLLIGAFLPGFCSRQNSIGFLLSVFLVFFLLANLRYPLQFPVDSIVEKIEKLDRRLEVTAELTAIRQLAGERTELDLMVFSLMAGDEMISVDSPLRLRMYVGERLNQLLPGDRLRFNARLRKPRLFGTPGEFHWPRYLASQDIALTGWLKGAGAIRVVGKREPFPLRLIAEWKESVAAVIDQATTEQQAPLVRALILGEKRILPAELRDTLSQAGISHLFAISGLHLGLLGMFGYRLLLSLYRRSSSLLNWQPPQRVLPLLLLPVLLGYLLLTGDAVSTRRAFFVAVLAAGFWFWRHTVNPLRLLMALAWLFLLVNPLLLWQPAWQLSFAGAAGILLWRPFWLVKVATLPFLVRGSVRLLLVTTAATLATLPLVLAGFHLFAPVGLLANLIAVPLVALLALPIGLCGLVLQGLPVLGELCFSCCGFLLQTTIHIVEWLLDIPGLSAQYLFLSRWQYLAIGFLLLPIIFLPQLTKERIGWRLAGICLLLTLLCGFMPSAERAEFALTMFSVGQGESLLLTNDRQQAVLVDGGGLYSDRFDVGERLLAPALGELGVRRLAAVILTHDHPDHRKGLIFILRQFPVDEFWSGVEFAELHPQLQEVLLEKSIPVRRAAIGWSGLESWKRGSMQLFRRSERANKNDSSLVLYLRTASGGLLLTGDLEKEGVDKLLNSGLPGPVSLLKLPHHGSRHSGTEQLIDVLQPQVCLVSSGYRNRYGLPAQQLVSYLRKSDVPLYRTDIMGTIRVCSVAGDWRVERWQDGLFR